MPRRPRAFGRIARGVASRARRARPPASSRAKSATAFADAFSRYASFPDRAQAQLRSKSTAALRATKPVVVAKLKKLSDEKVLKLWRKKCPELQDLWDLDDDPTSWDGLTWDEDGAKGNVTDIDLDDCGLSGVLPVEIGGLSELRSLALDGNELTGVPSSIGNLTKLEELYLSNNNLRSVPPEIGNCVNLVTLWLNNNELTSVPAELGNLLALEMLDVSENDLTTLPAEIGDLELLEQLDIYGNSEKMRLPASLQEDGKLEESGCNIVREDPEE